MPELPVSLRRLRCTSLQKQSGNIAREHAQLREALRALHAYLSSPPPLLDGGSVLVSIADGCCGEGSSDDPATFAKKSAAHLAWRRETMQRSQASSTLLTAAHRSRRPDHSPMLPRSGELIPAPTSRQSGAGGQCVRQEFDSQACTILAMDYYY